MLLLYGLGTMVGGGFYALLGKVAGEADLATPLAFLVAGILALINAFTYAELSSRFPVSAGEAQYAEAAFHKKWLSIVVGLVVILTGVVSAATLAVATIGFLGDVVNAPYSLSIFLLILFLTGLCIWGVGESVFAVLIITVIEIVALFFVVFICRESFHSISEITSYVSTVPSNLFLLSGIFSGAFLGFYAFIGFEDMANMAEEVKDAKASLPKAMVGSVVITTIIYVMVSTVAVLTVEPVELATANTPLAMVVQQAGNSTSTSFLVIASILTGLNGALVQIIMASRVLYGLGKLSPPIRFFSRVNKSTRTPVEATLFSGCAVLILALFFPLKSLAEATSAIILLLFAFLNLSLWKIKLTKAPSIGAKNYPFWLPIIGLFVCLAMLTIKVLDSFF